MIYIEKFEEFIEEGIDIDNIKRKISFNPNHENNVDTSVENNPTLTTEYGDGVKVWSIFKRKSNETQDDGNPLLYALKQEKNWDFKSEQDRIDILKQIHLIANKFTSEHKLGFTILIPSGNALNRMIGDIIVQKGGKNIILVDDVLTKITTEEVWEIASTPNSPFMCFYKDSIDSALRSLSLYLSKMDSERNGYFTRHFVTDSKMRDVLTTTLKLSDDAVARYSRQIDGKDILLIDDSISRGQTIKEACHILRENYEPRSITVLTLFSKLN